MIRRWAKFSGSEEYWGYLLDLADQEPNLKKRNHLTRQYQYRTRKEIRVHSSLYFDFQNVYQIFMSKKASLAHNPLSYHFNQSTGELVFSKDLPFLILAGWQMKF